MSNKSAKSRAEYGFRLDFPKVPFTINDFRKFKKYASVPYITLYKRVKNAVANGVLVVSDNRPTGGRGRPKAVYSRTDVKASVSASVAVKA